MDDFKVEGKVPVVMERFTIEKIVEDIALEIFFSTEVGTGSRSKYKSDDWESRLSISSKVAGVKELSREGGEGGREWAGVEEGLVCRLKWSFEILSDKYVANSCGRAARGDDYYYYYINFHYPDIFK